MAKRREQTKLTGVAAEFVRWARVCRVATVSAEGVPHLVPVCHALGGQKLYFGSGNDGTKVRNLQANPNVTVTVDEYSEHWDGLKGVMVQGRARLIARGPEFTRARDRLYEKYPQYSKEAALATSDSVIIEVTPTHVFTWGLK
jgi:nitroimidazol reductase NimA-like FMN-containing flavoprotein (pyridoxamine 5'-phosphate oxidase superfamily)